MCDRRAVERVIIPQEVATGAEPGLVEIHRFRTVGAGSPVDLRQSGNGVDPPEQPVEVLPPPVPAMEQRRIHREIRPLGGIQTVRPDEVLDTNRHRTGFIQEHQPREPTGVDNRLDSEVRLIKRIDDRLKRQTRRQYVGLGIGRCPHRQEGVDAGIDSRVDVASHLRGSTGVGNARGSDIVVVQHHELVLQQHVQRQHVAARVRVVIVRQLREIDGRIPLLDNGGPVVLGAVADRVEYGETGPHRSIIPHVVGNLRKVDHQHVTLELRIDNVQLLEGRRQILDIGIVPTGHPEQENALAGDRRDLTAENVVQRVSRGQDPAR